MHRDTQNAQYHPCGAPADPTITTEITADSSDFVSIHEYQALKADYEEFTYIVSHDLNAPLRHIQQFSEILLASLGERLSEDEKTCVTFIEQAIHRSQTMLEALLQLSRIATTGTEFTTVDTKHIVREAFQQLKPTSDSCRLILEEETLPTVYGDKIQLQLLFFHLLQNSMVFRRRDIESEISVKTALSENQWEFRIQDNGIGVDEGQEEQVFALFRKLHSDQDYPGAGAGLTMCKKIVARHGGRIWCEPSQRNGAIFLFTLPDAARISESHA